MHSKSDNEVNSNANVNANVIVSAKPTLNGYATTPATAAATATTNTSTSSSIDSCKSSTSTDSGVIINDNKITWNDNSNRSCNGSIGVTATDNSDEEVSPLTRPQNLSFNRNINVSNKNDNSNINIENIINISKSTQKQQQQQINGDIICGDGANSRRERKNTNSSSKRCSPSVSIRSTTISIVSIDENACDSSIIDSDSDYEPDGESAPSNYIVKRLGQQTTYEPDSPNLPNLNKGLQVVSQTISPGSLPQRPGGPLPETMLNAGSLCPPGLGPPMTPSTPQIGSIALSNSTDVTFGDKHFYEGPVTIQQFLIDSRDKWKAGEGTDGQDNTTFTYERDDKPGDQDDASKANQNPPTLSEQPFKFIFNRRAVVITGTIIVLTILIGILIVTTNVFAKQSIRKSKLLGDGDDSRKHIPINSTIGDDNVGGGKILRMVPRDAWLAQPPSGKPVPLTLPVHRVIVLSTLTEDCETQAVCTYRVRMTQTLNIESLNLDDIMYNFLIGGDGNVYEGRGWDVTGAHLRGFNEDSVSFAYIGTFKKLKPSQKQLDVTKLLLAEGVRLGKLSSDYELVSASKLDPTSTSIKADELYNSFKGWPHWSD